ncbi:hypothetical protein RJ639_013286 [Escallonia herrerae]|uniref:GRIP domain-containing protein n=1 Tax=Escallonia herrerae TaxID=1293975 RepID=A0AA88VGW4_9ASTE|nr:hypothetical protein RJ639_013286 [Escallonia herrerae]
MSADGGDISRIQANHVEDGVGHDKELIDMNDESDVYLHKENGLCDSNPNTDESHQLVQMVLELKFQNEYLKSQFQDLEKLHIDSGGSYEQRTAIEQDGRAFTDANQLHEKLDSMNRELLEERQTRATAEEALKHLRAVYSEADAKAHELSAKLAEAQQMMDQQFKERDEKYCDLDSKFSRLHKRAKQRIQEVQKEKEDLESQFQDVNGKAERASSQLSALQQELERTRQQANEALKVIDGERQQLRSANNKLRDDLEELRHSLEPKENALEALQQSLLEKEQMLEDMQGLLQAADEKRQASINEISSRHQKQLESLEAQLADSLSDRNKATETISSLQRLVAEYEFKIAEMDAASSGEAVRLRAAIESVKGELTHVKHEHEKEKESWEAATEALSKKVEIAEGNRIRAEIEAAKLRSQLELELSVQIQLLNKRESELMTAKEEINHLESEFASYKGRAHALLQRKDAELAAAKDNEQLKAQEEALKEAEKEILLAFAERDEAIQGLKDALASHHKELARRDASLSTAEQQIKNMEMKLTSALSSHQSEKEAWERSLQNIEETWRFRCETLRAQNEASSGENLQREVYELKQHYKKMKEEHDSFHDLADKIIEEKDKEISRLLDDNENLHRSLALRPQANNTDNHNTGFQRQDASNSSTSAAEQQILILARQQAQREEELSQSQRHILALQEELEELERENRLHSQQEAMLKEELRNMERMQRREGVDMTYLKNVILKLLETGEVEALLPVVAMLLQFSPDEMQKCQQAYRSSTDVPPSPASDASSGSTRSLFSRFSFS